MKRSEVETMKSLVRQISSGFKVELLHSEDILVEKPYVVRLRGKTVAYCADESSATIVKDAFKALGERVGMMTVSLAFGDRFLDEVDKHLENG